MLIQRRNKFVFRKAEENFYVPAHLAFAQSVNATSKKLAEKQSIF